MIGALTGHVRPASCLKRKEQAMSDDRVAHPRIPSVRISADNVSVLAKSA